MCRVLLSGGLDLLIFTPLSDSVVLQVPAEDTSADMHRNGIIFPPELKVDKNRLGKVKIFIILCYLEFTALPVQPCRFSPFKMLREEWRITSLQMSLQSGEVIGHKGVSKTWSWKNAFHLFVLTDSVHLNGCRYNRGKSTMPICCHRHRNTF